MRERKQREAIRERGSSIGRDLSTEYQDNSIFSVINSPALTCTKEKEREGEKEGNSEGRKK